MKIPIRIKKLMEKVRKEKKVNVCVWKQLEEFLEKREESNGLDTCSLSWIEKKNSFEKQKQEVLLHAGISPNLQEQFLILPSQFEKIENPIIVFVRLQYHEKDGNVLVPVLIRKEVVHIPNDEIWKDKIDPSVLIKIRLLTEQAVDALQKLIASPLVFETAAPFAFPLLQHKNGEIEYLFKS